MKWDCESFASQYTNIYNHPTLIKGYFTILFRNTVYLDPNSRLSRKALKRLERGIAATSVSEPVDEEMEEGSDGEVSTVSTFRSFKFCCCKKFPFRPKGETPEQKKMRKQAVKEAKRARRVEKKANKETFADEYRKVIFLYFRLIFLYLGYKISFGTSARNSNCLEFTVLFVIVNFCVSN